MPHQYGVCPKDSHDLDFSGRCGHCHGHLILGEKAWDVLYNIFNEVNWPPGKYQCPRCKGDFKNLKHKHGHLRIEACDECRVLWLDQGELNQLTQFLERAKNQLKYHYPVGKKGHELKKTYQKYVRANYEERPLSMSEKLGQLLLSIPIEQNLPPFRFPAVTWGLILLNIGLFVWTRMGIPAESFNLYTYIPGQSPYWHTIPAMFNHGGLGHLFMNMYFLKILGDNVEDVLGRNDFVIMYFLAGIGGFLASHYMNRGGIPHLGASGAVSAIIACYVVFFPRALLVFRVLIFFTFSLSAAWYIVFWLGGQFLTGAIELTSGSGNVAWEAHLVGFGIGFIWAFLHKKLKLI